MNSAQSRRQAALISLVASSAIFLLKYSAYWMTGSAAVMSDATESIVNVIAALIALFVIRFASQPADKEHPYGHGKAEYFSAAFEGGMIFFAALVIVYESIKALFVGQVLRQLDLGLTIIAFSALVNLVLGLYLKKVGQSSNSEALKASGVHVLSDVWTTIGVMIGLGLVWLTGLHWIDPIMAILVGLHLAWSGLGIVRESISALIDQVDMKAVEEITQVMQEHRKPGIIDIHHLKVIRSGAFHHIDAHLVVPEYWEVATAHSATHDFEEAVVAKYQYEGEIAFHLDPCRRSYCSSCDVFDCPLRQAEFKKRIEFTVESLTSGPRPETYGSEPA